MNVGRCIAIACLVATGDAHAESVRPWPDLWRMTGAEIHAAIADKSIIVDRATTEYSPDFDEDFLHDRSWYNDRSERVAITVVGRWSIRHD
jgi:hypothetical protein